MKTFKIIWSDGNSTVTGMNANLQEAKDYYLNNWFNHGDNDYGQKDHMVKGVLVTEVNSHE